jgi:hypothetical protein
LQSQAFACCNITLICAEAQIIAHFILTCGKAQSQQLQSHLIASYHWAIVIASVQFHHHID